jgi:O-antigen ligase
MAILASVGLVGTWTRGIWGQLVAVLVMVAIDYFWRGKLPLRIIVGIAMMIALGIGGIAWFPAARQSFVSRFEKLLPSERAGLDPTDSIVVKATERENLRKAIATRPWSGFGFGEGDFHQFGLEEASRFHNFFLGFALKTGWIGMAILLAMLFAICWRAFRIGLRRSSGRSGLVLRGIVYALFWGMAASTSNPHIATPAFILSIGLLMALTDVTERASLVARVRYRIHENKHLRRQLQFDAAP